MEDGSARGRVRVEVLNSRRGSSTAGSTPRWPSRWPPWRPGPVTPDGKTAMGLSNQTCFLRPISEGRVHATARARHKGRTTWVWDVEFTDDEERLCALSRMTIAVRDLPAADAGAQPP